MNNETVVLAIVVIIIGIFFLSKFAEMIRDMEGGQQ